MAETRASSLRIIAAHALWSRDPKWSKGWYEQFYLPLCRLSIFVPPLLAYELCSVAERGERLLGELAGQRKEFEGWSKFLYWLNEVAFSTLARSPRHGEAVRWLIARRLMRVIGLGLLSRDWRSDGDAIFSQDQEANERLLLGEAQRLSGKSQSSLLAECWEFLDQAAARNELQQMIPLASLMSLAADPGKEVDPFLSSLIGSAAQEPSMAEPQIRGTNPRADNPRKILWPTGEFAKRDLGPLPLEPGRLAPTELVLLQGGAKGAQRSEGRARSGAIPKPLEAKDWRILFAFKVTQGQLLQRFSHFKRNAFMEPIGRLQVEIAASPKDHQLNDPPRPPIVSWYRAVAVQVVHQFAQLAIPFKWSMDYVISHAFGTNAYVALIDSHRVGELGESPESALQVLAEACPCAFRAGWSLPIAAAPSEPASPTNLDILIQVVFGEPQDVPQATNPSLRVLAAEVRSVRVERAESGYWGMANVPRGYGAGLTPVAESSFDQIEEDPGLAAQTIIKQVLGLQDDEENQA